MRTISKLWENFYAKLDQIDPEHPLKNEVVKQTMRPWNYKKLAEEIIERAKLKVGDSILEVGGSYGGLAQEVLNIISISYTLVENEAMLIQAKKFLGNKVEYIEAGKIETLQHRKFTLFISTHCLSETPFEYRKYILKNIIKNCQEIFIIDLDDMFKLTPRMLKKGYEIAPAITEKYLKKYFIIKERKYRHNRIRYIGERRE